MTDPKLHELLDQTQFGDRLTLAHRSGKHTTRISGPVLTDQTHDPSVGIDLLDGDPHIVRTSTGVVWAPVVQATLHRGGEVIAKWDAADHLEAQNTPQEATSADLTASQPEPDQLGGSDFMADRLADPEVLAGYLAAHAREVREQVAGELHYEAKAMTRFNAHPAMSDAAATAAAYREGIRDGLTAAAHIACAEQTTARQDADLTASQGETGHEDQYETDFNRWLDSLSPGQREQITRDIEAAHDQPKEES